MRTSILPLIAVLSIGCSKGPVGSPDVDVDVALDVAIADVAADATIDDMPDIARDLGSDVRDTGPDAADTGPPRPVCTPEQLGVSCAADPCECEVAACYASPLLSGATCVECGGDADCAATTGYGCNLRNVASLNLPTCSETGGFGEGCETDAACSDGGHCATLIEIIGVYIARNCGECVTNDDCQVDERCAPDYGAAPAHGHYRCVAKQSVPNDEGCSLTGDGSECISEQCAPLTITGIPIRGVCSPCNEDADCPNSGRCQLPIGLPYDGVIETPGACMPP